MPHLLRIFVVVVLVVAALFTGFARSQIPSDLYWPTSEGAQCIDIDTLPAERVPPACKPYITYKSIYIDDNQAAREIYNKLVITNTWNAPSCVVATFRFACVNMFRPCVNVPVPQGFGKANGTNETVAVGRYICRPGCDLVYDVCYEAITEALTAIGAADQIPAATTCQPPWSQLYGVNLPGVQTFPNTTQYRVPVTATNWTSTFSVDLTCYSDNFNITVPPPEGLCPPGMYFTDFGTCALNCPYPYLTDEDFDAVAVVTGGFGWVSFLATLLLIGSFSLEPKRRQFPYDLYIYFVASLCLLSLSFCVATIIGFRDMICSDDKTPNSWGAAGCTVQGILYVYFSLTSVAWWLVIAFNYFLLVFMNYEPKPAMEWRDWLGGLADTHFLSWKKYFKWETIYVLYHAFAWGIPAIPVIIALSAHKLGYGGYEIWCSIHSDSTVTWQKKDKGGLVHSGGDPANLWNLILHDIPIFCAVCIGCGLLCLVIVAGIRKHALKIFTWGFIKEHFRVFLFMGFYAYIYIFVFSFHIEEGAEIEDQYDAFDSYIGCSFNAKLLLDTVKKVVSCELDYLISFPLWFMQALNVASQGLIVFLILGTTKVFSSQCWFFATLPLVLLRRMDPVPVNGFEEPIEIGGAAGGGGDTASIPSSGKGDHPPFTPSYKGGGVRGTVENLDENDDDL